MNKKMNWTLGSFDFSNPVPEEEPKKVKYILNTDFGPIKKGTEMVRDGEDYLADCIGGISINVTEQYVTKVTELEFGDRVKVKGGVNELARFIVRRDDEWAWVLVDGDDNASIFRIDIITPYK